MQKSLITQKNLPDAPGIYQFLNEHKEILYIGKATSLRDRVKSYFSHDLIHTRGPLLVDMVTQSHDISWIETDSVLEALILESNLIKKYKPLYNTKEKDNKSYNFVVITDEAFPRIFLERARILEHKKNLPYKIKALFGPYTSGAHIQEALRIIRKIFPFRDKKSLQKHTERFYKQLGLTPQLDTHDEQARDSYVHTIRHIRLFLQGKKKEVLRSLEKQMQQYARLEQFEQAVRIRNQISALNHINDVSLIKREHVDQHTNMVRIEAYDIAHLQGSHMVGVMTVLKGGEVDKSEYRTFSIRGFTRANDIGALREVLERRLKHTEWQFPNLIVIDGGRAQYALLRTIVKEHNLDRDIDVCAVVKDEHHKAREIIASHAVLKKYDQTLMLLANSEAHRFAIGKHRQQRSKTFNSKKKLPEK